MKVAVVVGSPQNLKLAYRDICSDADAMHWPEEDIGNLRVALNALVRLFRM